MGKNYWMVVQTSENYGITEEMGFTMHGLGAKYRRRAQRMQPDDKMLFYLRDLRKWPAVASITSKFFEERTPVWKPTRRGEDFRFRVKIRPDFVLKEEDYIDGLILGPRLEYVKRWPPERWPLAFQDSLHLLSQRDFRLIEGEIRRIVNKARRQQQTERRELDSYREQDGSAAGPPYDSPLTDGDAGSPASIAVPPHDDESTLEQEGTEPRSKERPAPTDEEDRSDGPTLEEQKAHPDEPTLEYEEAQSDEPTPEDQEAQSDEPTLEDQEAQSEEPVTDPMAREPGSDPPDDRGQPPDEAAAGSR